MRHLDDLRTPSVAIDLARVEHNISTMQAYCDLYSIKLRPHVKTHKLPFLAHKQLAAGAKGITAQKLDEALTMAAAGLDDILLTYNIVSEANLEPLTQLALSTHRLRLGLDNAVAVELAARAAQATARTIEVLVEFESGNRRTGVIEPLEALRQAQGIRDSKGLHFAGFMTHPVSAASAEWVTRARELFEREGIAIETFSGGGTPGMWHAHEIQGLSELRVGTYIYHDRATVGAGVATFSDCALQVHATVVSVPEKSRAVIDAGSKTLSSDLIPPAAGRGYGHILEYPQALITTLSEEHGVLDVSACERAPKIGERVRIIPNHACVVTNLHDEVVAHRQGRIEAVWPVWARGKTR